MVRFLAALCAVAALCAPAGAQQIETISVAPDGATVLVGGSNRTVYTIDAAAMTVTGRRYVPALVRQIFHGAEGALVYFRDDAKRLTAHRTADMSEAWSVGEADAAVYAPAEGRIALLDRHYKDDAVTLVDAATGGQLARVAMGKQKADLIALRPGAAAALVFTGAEKTEGEEAGAEPADLTKLQQADFKQRHDGYASQVIEVDFEQGGFAAVATPYRISYPKQVAMQSGRMMILRGVTDSLLVGADGAAELIDLGEDYFNHAGIDRAGETFILTNGVDLRFRPVAGGAAEGLLSAERLRGGPTEWVTAMAEGADGTLYFGTNAYRLLKVPPARDRVEAMIIQ